MFDWVVTVAGALLCLIFYVFLDKIGRNQRVKFGKIGPVVGIAGAVMLTAMAIVGRSSRDMEPKRTMVIMEKKHGTIQRSNLHKKLISLYYRTLEKVGKRPSKDHVAYEDENGKLSWILKENYIKILIKQRKKDSK